MKGEDVGFVSVRRLDLGGPDILSRATTIRDVRLWLGLPGTGPVEKDLIRVVDSSVHSLS